MAEGVTDPIHTLREGRRKLPAQRTHLSAVSWDLPGRCEKLPLVCLAANSMKLSLGWVDDGRVLSGWMERFIVR